MIALHGYPVPNKILPNKLTNKIPPISCFSIYQKKIWKDFRAPQITLKCITIKFKEVCNLPPASLLIYKYLK